MNKLLTTLSAFALLLSPAMGAVGDVADFSALDGCNFLQGKLTANDLKGKVVFVEYWGVWCGPCRGKMPEMQKMYNKYKDQGFVLIASHHGKNSAQEVADYIKSNNLTFPTCMGFTLPQAGVGAGYPFSALIGADGRVVANNFPSKVEPLVEAEMKKLRTDTPILDGLTLNTYKKYQSVFVEGTPDLESKVEALRNKQGDDEARQICETFDSWKERRINLISSLQGADALNFVQQAKGFKKSVPSVTEFDAAIAEISANPTYAKLNDMRKKEKAMRKKLEEGKKVSPKAVEAMISTLGGMSPGNPALAGSVNSLSNSLKDLQAQAENTAGAKKPAKNARAPR